MESTDRSPIQSDWEFVDEADRGMMFEIISASTRLAITAQMMKGKASAINNPGKN